MALTGLTGAGMVDVVVFSDDYFMLDRFQLTSIDGSEVLSTIFIKVEDLVLFADGNITGSQFPFDTHLIESFVGFSSFSSGYPLSSNRVRDGKFIFQFMLVRHQLAFVDDWFVLTWHGESSLQFVEVSGVLTSADIVGGEDVSDRTEVGMVLGNTVRDTKSFKVTLEI